MRSVPSLASAQDETNERDNQLSANNRRRKDIYRLPRADVELIRGLRYREKLEFIDRAILENAHFLFKIVENPEMFGHDTDHEDYESDHEHADNKHNEGNRQQPRSGNTHGHGHGDVCS
jgi:carnosine N-methyltransferase